MSMYVQRFKRPISAITALSLFLSVMFVLAPTAKAGAAPASTVEGFEQLAGLVASSAQANSVRLDLVSRPETIYHGQHAVKLSYDFTGKPGTSAAYVNLRDPDGTAGRSIEGEPKKIGLWVYGDGNNHWLRAQLRDSTGTLAPVDFTSSSGLNWKGWRYVSVAVPATLKPPIKINQIYIAETKADNKNSGAIYFDQLRAFYTDSTVYGLDFAGLHPMQTGESLQAKVFAAYQNAVEPVEVTSGISFRSGNEEVATVDANGTVHAHKAGSAVITASYGNAPEAAYTLTVTDEPVAPQSLPLSAPVKLEAGTSERVRVYAVYGGSAEPAAIVSGAAFESSRPDIAAVDASGRISALKTGTAVITVQYDGATATHAVTVTDPVPVLQSIALSGLRTMEIGQTRQARVFGTYTWLPEPVEITSGVAFVSSDPGVASVGPTGEVKALKPGAARITATYQGKSASYYLAVNKVAVVPKTELRAAWIATVDNVDWPSKGVTEAEQQKQEYIELLDELQAAGMNAVIMQIKPTADAFYPSEYGPWSEWLTGVQGKDPGYNPLAFMLEEVHKRNMEFHAWFNPYRISLHDRIDLLVEDHPARQHPDWVVSYGGKLYFNPGIPEAKDFIIDSIMEVVKNYDIDAVHFDDYFYPYPVSGVDFPDQEAFEQYGGGFTNKADWRRNNVDTFVQEMAAAIKREKSYVKFGISPFGIWRNKSQDPSGSDTNGLSAYDDIYADTKKWVEHEWIDYITPQIYWYMGYSPAAYDKLIEWWNGLVQGKNVHLYSGQAVYRIGSSDPAWMNPDEMPTQVAYNRNFDNVKGSMFFSAKWLPENPLGFTDRLKNDLYKYKALIPSMPWIDAEAPGAPAIVSAIRKPAGVELTWYGSGATDESYYVVYRFDGETAGSVQEAARIVDTVRKREGAVQTYIDRTAADGLTYTYVVTAVDRIHNESEPSGGITMTNILDTAPPVTAAAAQGTSNNGWYVSEVSVKLSAADDLSGVERTEFSTDHGETWTLYTEPVSIAADGVHTLLYRSTDRTGNIEQALSVEIPVDRTAPTIEIVGAGAFAIDDTVTITCAVSDTVSGIVYNPCTGPLVHARAFELEPGEHLLTVEAEDAAGNKATVSATYTVIVTEEGYASLIREFVTGDGEQGVEDSLLKKLEKRQITPLIQELEALAGKKLISEHAAVLIRLAERLQ
ncbi:family 10 glycosylhydrolase [Paenibacillus thermotolerans]|uniref:family 10 glycosylhydrolase n=1 Tax=Paenibacillus thermotolerans TaxID=3027807 RepID=UPI0023676BB4|nr:MULTISPECIES: family 10 glycosylhydrolase [unclassified Paenibacillus]